MNIIINPKKKQWICNPYSFISIDKYTIKALNIEYTYRYLGINIGSLDNTNNSINDDLTSKLLSISKSTLKPQYKLFMFKNHIIPSMLHTLTFSNVYLNSLKTMDRSRSYLFGRFSEVSFYYLQIIHSVYSTHLVVSVG